LSRISVIGLDGSPLREEARSALKEAALVAGGRRHLEAAGVDPSRSVELRGDLSEALAKLESSEGPVAVLASGDPGFFGIVRLLSERFGRERLCVIPGVSSVALAFARAGLPWDDALVVSAHGREPRRALNACRAHPKVAVLTAPGFGPAELGRELAGLERIFLVAERLGEPDERLFCGDAAALAGEEWRDPNVVLVLDGRRPATQKGWAWPRPPGGGWALPEEEFEHRAGMITRSEVRALVLARLGPRVGDLVWDVGAGSGSVAVECARLGAAAVAVEREGASAARIRQNAARHGVCLQVVEGEAPEALSHLPEPDAVFVGGTGGAFEEILRTSAARARRSVVLTLISLERVVPAGEILAECGLEVETALMQTARLRGVGAWHRLAAENPTFVVCGRRPC
jgi:precorrin-6Y C5,15-methyltransferase (decarboxylating)